MDPVTMMLISMGLSGGQAAMSLFGDQAAYRAQKRATRFQQAELMQNAEMSRLKSTFEQNRIDDSLAQAQGDQINYYAGGNIDPMSGSPAVLSAMSSMQAETDKLLVAARGQSEVADAWGQIQGLQSRVADKRKALGYGVATTLLNTASQWASLGTKGMGNSQGGKSGMNSGGMSPAAPRSYQPQGYMPGALY